MAKIVWDAAGEHFYETGTDHGVLYPQSADGTYPKGVPWNGLTAVSESPSGAEPTDLWADNIKYASIRSAETFGATIEAYTYPEEFAVCDGSAELSKGVYVGQQARQPFGFSYRTNVANDTATEEDDGYKIHLIYSATASPSEKAYQTVNDSPEAITFSWELTTTPVPVEGFKPTSTLVIDTRKASKAFVQKLEEVLYGTDTLEPKLPSPSEIIEMIKETSENGTGEEDTQTLFG